MREGNFATPIILGVEETVDSRVNRSTIIPLEGRTTTIEPVSSFGENGTVAMSVLLRNESSVANATQRRDSLYVVVPITVIYVLIFFTGLVGNVSTCVVIARNRSMHTATNYYLFSLAISDLLLLISGLPPEMYYIWSHFPYVFGEIFCVVQSFAAETSANATVLTITAFTIERYVAICHPFLSHTMSKLSRAVRYVILIWVSALCLAIPQAIQFGIVLSRDKNGTDVPETDTCSRKWVIVQHAFEISTILFFVAPMTIITVLYVLIGVKLRRSRLLTATGRNTASSGANRSEYGRGRASAQRNVIRMLVAVVVAFFICWAPFHAQRLLAVYAQNSTGESREALSMIYMVLTYVSGVFYYLSTTVNPLLYNIMSNKFREAFKSMLAEHCGGRRSSRPKDPRRQTYSSLSRYGRSAMKRGLDRNTGSLSASDENQKSAIAIRNDESARRSRRNWDAQLPIVKDQSGLNFVCRANEESSKRHERSKLKDGRVIGDRTRTPSPESNGQTSGPVVTRDCTSVNVLNRNSPAVSNCSGKVQRPALKTVNLGKCNRLIAQRLRFGSRNFFTSQQRGDNDRASQGEKGRRNRSRSRNGIDVGPGGRTVPKFQSHPSIESANTISNSSLQDLGETEFTGSELARYMGELNYDLVT